MKTNPLTDVLSDPTRGVNRSHNILCFLFRKALLWGRDGKPVGFNGWSKRANEFFKKPHNEIYKNDKGNLNKDLMRPEFTWPTFKKAVDFLDPLVATLTVELTWPDDNVTEHTMVIDPAEDESSTDVFGSAEETNNTPFEGKSPPVNSLARFWRRIVIKEGITPEKWDKLLTQYVNAPISGIDLTTSTVNDARNNVNRQLMENTLSWTKFRMGLNFLDSKKVALILECRWSDKPDDVSIYKGGTFNPKHHKPKRTNSLKKAR